MVREHAEKIRISIPEIRVIAEKIEINEKLLSFDATTSNTIY